MDLHLYLDTQNRQLVRGFGDSSAATLPPLMQGDTVRLVLHGQKPAPAGSFVPYVDDPINFTQIKAAIGFGPDAAPRAGTFKIRMVGGTNVTVALPFNVSQEDFLAAVNGLGDVYNADPDHQGIRLDQVSPVASNLFLIRWVSTAITATFEVVVNRLEPLCFVRSTVVNLPAGQLQVLKIMVAPLAFTQDFVFPQLAPVTVASVRVGSVTQNCVQGIAIPEEATGSVAFGFASNQTSLISVDALNTTTDASGTIAAALNALYSDGATYFSVSYQDAGKYLVEFVGPLAKRGYDLLAATMANQTPANTPYADFSLDGPSIELAIHTLPSIALRFELEITNGAEVNTMFQVPVTIVNDMIDAPMNTESEPDWLQPGGSDYPPYDPGGAMVSVPGAYVSPVGNGGTTGSSGQTSFVFTHNLGTQNLIIEVRETGGTKHRLPDNLYTASYVNDDQIQIVFPATPDNGQYFVILAAVVPGDRALPHHTHPISDIEDLEGILAELQAAITDINGGGVVLPPIPENRLPAHIGWYTRNADGSRGALRFDRFIPDELIDTNIPRLDANGRLPVSNLPYGVPYLDEDGQLIVVIPGNPDTVVVLLDETGHIPVSALPVDPSTWPGLYTAIIKALQSGSPLPKGYIPIVIPKIDEEYPPDVVLSDGGTPVKATLANGLPGYANAGLFSGAFPVPTTAMKGKVWTVSDGATAAPARYRAAQVFVDGQKVGCDGNQYYPVVTDVVLNEDTGGAWPAEMEKKLFSLHISPAMLADHCRLHINAQLEISLTGAAARDRVGLYRLMVRFARVTGYPLINQVVYDDPALYETFYVTAASTIHSFQLELTRTGDVRTARAGMYGRLGGVMPPVASIGSDVLIDARLQHFDLSDSTEIAVGQVKLSMPNVTASIVELTEEG